MRTEALATWTCPARPALPRPRTALRATLALLLLALAAGPAAAQVGTTYYVDADVAASGTGLSWASAKKYLGEAFNAASSGAQIWIAEGVYYPDEGTGRTDGDRHATFQLKHGVNVYGGFDPQSGADTWAERNPATHVTVLSGDLAKDDTKDANGIVLDWADVVGSDNAYHVVFAGTPSPAAGVTATLDGVTITAGLEDNTEETWPYDVGPGLVTCSGSNMTLSQVVFRGNKALPSGAGGAAYFWDTTQTLTNVTFTGNASCQGGAAYSRGGSSTYSGVVFEANDAANPSGGCSTAAVSGGGLYAAGGVTLNGVQFRNNTAITGGGGMSTYGPITASNVLFEGNSAAYLGGGMEDGGCSTLTDVTFRNNSGPSYGGGGLAYQCNGAAGTYTRLTFVGNSTPGSGGGLYGHATTRSVDIVDALFAGNQASMGGAIFTYYGTLRITNAVLRGNRATSGEGGGIFGQYGGATLTNVTIAGNSPNALTGSWSSEGYADWTVRNSILWGNAGAPFSRGDTIDVRYSVVEGGCPSGASCDHVLTGDPVFVTPVDPAAAPTTAGDVHVGGASPAIDAGDNLVASPALPATDLDGNPRRLDISTVTDTGNGTAPIVDMGAYEFAFLGDLTITKTNGAGGNAAPSVPFTWTITIRNAGDATATFAGPGGLIARDELPLAPSQATYGTPTIATSGVSGSYGGLAATISGSDLEVAFASGSLVLAPLTGAITITVPVTPTALGTLSNPRSGGICVVDPNDVVDEVLESNNAASDVVAVGGVAVTAVVHDAAHAAVASAPVGTSIHGNVAVAGPAGGTTPTGSVTFELYDNATCSGAPISTRTAPLSGGSADTSTFPAVSFWHRGRYDGDASHQAGASACTLFAASQAGPIFTVNTTADDAGDGACTEAHCTLREAILASNAAPGANTILFNVGLAQTITLAAPLPAIVDPTGTSTVDGEASGITVNGGDAHQIFRVGGATTATLARLVIANGGSAYGSCTATDPCGGGLTVAAGATVTLLQSRIESCVSPTIVGGAFNEGTLTVEESTVSGNSGFESGAFLNNGTLTLRRSTVSGNTAALYGGGIFNLGLLTIENSTFSANSAMGTSSGSGGGAIDQYGAAASTTVLSSTFTGNTAVAPNQARSGIWLEGGTLTLRSTIVANNGGGADNFDGATGFTSLGANLSNAWNGMPTAAGDLTGDPALDALADNGGLTRTHALLPSSPAVDADPGASCPATDQRGVTRPQGAGCDIGAFEVVPPEADVWVSKVLTTAGPFLQGQSVSYTLTVGNAGPGPATAVQVMDTPSNLLIANVSGGGCAALPCSIASLAAGANVTIAVTATIVAAGSFDNSATVSSAVADPNPVNDTDATGNGGTAAAAADLSIAKTLTTAGPYLQGQTVSYTLVVANAGPAAASSVLVSDSPANMTITGVTGGVCATLPCTLASLAAGANVTVTVTAVVVAAGPFDNSAAVSSAMADPNPANDVDAIGNGGTAIAAADVSIVKTLSTPGPYLQSQTVSYTLVVANSGPAVATGVLVTDTPTNLTISGVTGGGCAALPCTIANLEAGASATVTIAATIGAAGPFDNSATASSPLADPNPANDVDSTGNGGTAIAAADVSIVKTLSTPGPYLQGQTVAYTLDAANAGPATAPNVIVTDTPANLTITGITGAGCAALPCTLSSLAAGANVSISVTATIVAAGPFDNSASVSSALADPNLANDVDSTGNGGTAGTAADVSIVKTLITPGPYLEGQAVSYSLVVANAGPAAATSVLVADTPANLTITAVTGAGCAALPCTIGSLAAGASATVTVTAAIGAAGPFDNSVTVSSAEADPNPSNNVDSTGNGGTAAAAADLSIAKTLTTAGPYLQGQAVSYTLVVANAGPAAATSVQVTDTPTNLTIAGVSGAGCVALPCTLASLAVGANVTISVTATIAAANPFDNSATVSSAEADPNPSNNFDSTGNGGSAVAAADVSMDKTLTTPGPYLPGQAVSYTLVVANAGPATATDVQVMDTPTNLTITNVAGGGCSNLPCTIASLPAGADVTITVTASIDAKAPFDNSAAASSAVADPITANNTDATGNGSDAVGGIVATPNPVNMRVPIFSLGSMTLSITNDSPITASFTLLERPIVPVWQLFVPARPTWQVAAERASDLTARAVPEHPLPQVAVSPLQPNAVLNFPTDLVYPWGIGFNTVANDMWINDIADAGGDGLNHRFLTAGTNTGDTIDISSWVSIFAADMTYDPWTNRIWQVNVGDDGDPTCIYELNPLTRTSTGNSICPAFGTSQRGLAFDPVTDTFFAGSWNDGVIHRFDRNGDILESTNAGLEVSGLAYNPSNGHLFVMANTDAAADLYVLDVNNGYAVVSSFKVAGMADYDQAGLEADCAGNLYAVNQGTGEVLVVPSGETGFCSFREIPWLDENPKSGVLAPGATQPVTLDFITALQWPGFHQGELRVTATDPFVPIAVPVNYTIAFLDVPVGSFADAHIHALAGARITRGCGGGNFCPDDTIDRAEMAILMVRAMHGPLYAPPSAVGIFSDVVVTDTDNTADYVEQLYRDGVVAGCGTNPLRYCPNDLVNRAQMSVFVAKGLGIPTAPDTGFFTDVSGTIYAGFAPYAEALYNNGITAGCGDHIFCPATEITRNQLAVWLVKALGLPMAPPTP